MTHTKTFIQSLNSESQRELFFSLLDGIRSPEFRGYSRNSKNQLVIKFAGYKPQSAYNIEELALLPFGVRYVAMEFDAVSGWTFCYSAYPKFD